jgi:hypothetical protein
MAVGWLPGLRDALTVLVAPPHRKEAGQIGNAGARRSEGIGRIL